MLRISRETLRVLNDAGCKKAHVALSFLSKHLESDTECFYNEEADSFTAHVPWTARKRTETVIGMPAVKVG